MSKILLYLGTIPGELHNEDEIHLKALLEQTFVVFFQVDKSKTTKEQLKIVAVRDLNIKACVKTSGSIFISFVMEVSFIL